MSHTLDKNISILIPDGEAPVLMVVLNCLSEVKGLKIHVMSSIEDIPMKSSKNIYKFSYYPESNSETDLIKNINSEIDKHKIDLVMPIFEHAISTITKHIDLITRKEKLCLLPSYNDFKTANNKGLLANFLEKNKLPFPKSHFLEKNKEIDYSQINYPILLKPVEGIGGGVGIYVFNKEQSLKEFINSDKFDCTYIAQDYIKGFDIDCSVLCKNGKILAYTIQKGTMFGSSKFAPQIGIEFLDESLLYQTVEKLMKALNWSGVAHLDTRFDERTNEFKVIEVNPRFWGSLEGSLFAGVNFPYLYCLSSLNQDFDVPKYKHIKFLILKGLVKSIKINKSTIFRVKFIFNNTPIKYMFKDPKPTLSRFTGFVKRKIFK